MSNLWVRAGAHKPFSHVTPMENLSSILEGGLDPDRVGEHFPNGRGVYLGRSDADPAVWAKEIARQTGKSGQYAVLHVAHPGGALAEGKTEHGPQYVVRHHIHPDLIEYVGSVEA